MTRFTHPVLGADLLATPEMQLRHPAEGPGRESSDDEGAGGGFDQMSADAYAERWSYVSDPPSAVLEWYEQRLEQLGWHRTGTTSDGMLSVSRDPDERVSVWVVPGVGSPPSAKFARHRGLAARRRRGDGGQPGAVHPRDLRRRRHLRGRYEWTSPGVIAGGPPTSPGRPHLTHGRRTGALG